MLHFFPRYDKDVSDQPFATELRRLGVPHRFFGASLNLRYATLPGLLLRVYPTLAWFALRSAVRSLLFSRPRPTAAVVGSDVEALVFGAIRLLFGLRTLIVFETLIITPRRSPRMDAIYRRYYALILSLIDLAICHSSGEVARYAREFPASRCRFAFVPYGTTVTGAAGLMAATAAGGGMDGAIVAAGRSGRDYRTLAAAIAGLPCRLDIICDTAAAVAGIAASPQLRVVTGCFDRDYIAAVARALLVVVPLSVDDVSAGQMVLLQAAALGKARVITRTATTLEYASDGEDALFVAMGDVAAMREAIERLIADPALRARLGANAAARFEREHSTEAYVRGLVAAIGAP